MQIMIIDDHPVVRKGLKSILEDIPGYNVCAEAEDAATAIKLLAEHEPELAIIDLELKGDVSGIELISVIKKRYKKIIILVMSMNEGTIFAERSIKAGARGYITKAEASDNIMTAIDSVISGRLYLSNSVSSKIAGKMLLGSADDDIDVNVLSNREFEIFRLIGRGYKRNEIAKKLNININTIESHRRNIRDKFSIEKSSDLTKIAINWSKYSKETGES